ncbi:MAG: hypothetical protein QM780_00200 [Hyphomicrobium sp.]|uniref:hypothetical protein n=1 Tax=Hyphomicrobium sp. TaxID=82 RepID=UPI0039E4AE4F
MNKIFSLVLVAGALAISGVPAFAESLPALEIGQISDRAVPTYSGAAHGSDASVTEQEIEQFGNSARPDVDASASRGHDESLVKMELEQIPH